AGHHVDSRQRLDRREATAHRPLPCGGGSSTVGVASASRSPATSPAGRFRASSNTRHASPGKRTGQRSSSSPTFWNSLRSRYPHLAIARFSPPNRFSTPSGSSDGPYSTRSSVPSGSSAVPNEPRGNFGWLAADTHQAPPAG